MSWEEYSRKLFLMSVPVDEKAFHQELMVFRKSLAICQSRTHGTKFYSL